MDLAAKPQIQVRGNGAVPYTLEQLPRCKIRMRRRQVELLGLHQVERFQVHSRLPGVENEKGPRVLEDVARPGNSRSFFLLKASAVGFRLSTAASSEMMLLPEAVANIAMSRS